MSDIQPTPEAAEYNAFLIYFEDSERESEVFCGGGAEKAAHNNMDGKHRGTWECIRWLDEAIDELGEHYSAPAGYQGWQIDAEAKQRAWDAFYATAKRELPHEKDGTLSGTFVVAVNEALFAAAPGQKP